MTQEDLQRDVQLLQCILTDGRVYPDEAASLDRVIAILEPLAGLSDAAVDAMLVQTSNLGHSWTGASDNALTDTEHDRHRLIANGYAAISAVLTAMRGQR